jgi:hypothetical protein
MRKPLDEIIHRVVAATKAAGQMPDTFEVPLELWLAARCEFFEKFHSWPVAAEIDRTNYLIAGIPVVAGEGQMDQDYTDKLKVAMYDLFSRDD